MKSRLHPFVISIICCIAFVIFASHAISSQPVGKATQAVHTTKSGLGPVFTNDPIFVGDEFIVGTNGSLIILFADESVLTLKAGSKAKIQAFKMGKPGMALIKATAGKYRYTPGRILSQGGVQYVANDNTPLTTDELAAASSSNNSPGTNTQAEASEGDLAETSVGTSSSGGHRSESTTGSAASELAKSSATSELATGSAGSKLAAGSYDSDSTTLGTSGDSAEHTGNAPEQVVNHTPDQSNNSVQNNAYDSNGTESNASGTGSEGTQTANNLSMASSGGSTQASNWSFAGGDSMAGCTGNDCMGVQLGGPVLGGEGMEGDFMTANQALSSQELARLETLNQVLDTSNQNLAAGIANIGPELGNGPGITFDTGAITDNYGNTPEVGNINAGYVGMIDSMTNSLDSMVIKDDSGMALPSVFQNQNLNTLQKTGIQQTFNTRAFAAQKSLNMQQLNSGNLGLQRLSVQSLSLSPQIQRNLQNVTKTIQIDRFLNLPGL